MKRITVVGYPDTFSFNVRKELPLFNNEYCEIRQEILLRQFKRQNIYSPCHLYVDYVIEEIEVIDNEEFWHLCS